MTRLRIQTIHAVVNSLQGYRPYIVWLTAFKATDHTFCGNSLQGYRPYILWLTAFKATDYTLWLTAFKATDYTFCG